MDSYFPQQNFGRRPDQPRYDLLFVKRRQGAMSFEMVKNFTEEMAAMWVSNMENTDSTTGAHWKLDETNAVREKLGLTHICKHEFWAVMNSLYSDYGKTLAKTNVTPEIYGELARDWIEDDDAVKHKAAAYFKYVVAHD